MKAIPGPGVTKSIDTNTCISASLKAGLCQWVNLQKDLRLWLSCGCCSQTCYTGWELSSISHPKFVYGEWIPSCSSNNSIPSTTMAAEEFFVYAMSPVPDTHTESNTVLFQPLQYLGQNGLPVQNSTFIFNLYSKIIFQALHISIAPTWQSRHH